ncbi:MAG TPA: aspartate carbamoyltransferase regulatory subunit [Gammaproteobacteria bacterium]|jgi:aspartate carbamoyltransferase regulatory subunit|nr:aspartate carbamoyltransferase regulatory subunit [Gammaproteobacteria bacterium]
MTKTLSVSAIQNGTVVDHITTDQTLRIMHMLRLLDKKHTVTVGFNLPSKSMKLKDLIKIENHELTPEEANQITIFAPDATINIIKNYEVVKKLTTQLPESIKSIFICPNPNCIIHSEPVESFFYIHENGKVMKLTCKYCEKSFERNQVKVKQ